MLLFQYQPGDALNACGPRIFVGDESLDYAIIEALRSVGAYSTEVDQGFHGKPIKIPDEADHGFQSKPIRISR